MVHVIPENYCNASQWCYGMSYVVDNNRMWLVDTLNACQNMSGSDDTGRAWGEMFDKSVASLFDQTDDLITALNNYGGVLYQGAQNHLDAEKASGGDDGVQLPPERQGGVDKSGKCVAMPTAGGPGMGLQAVTELINDVGVPVPDGDPDKLAKAASTFKRFADSLYAWQDHSLPPGQSGPVSPPTSSDAIGAEADAISQLDSPEVDIIVNDLEELQSAVDEVQEAARQLAQSCLDHKDWMCGIRDQMKEQLEELAKELAIGIAVSIGLSFVTVGFSALGEAAAASAQIARAGKIIKDIIDAAKGAQALGKASYLKDASRLTKWKKQLDRYKFLRKIQKSDMKEWQKAIAKKGRFGEDAAGVDPNVAKAEIRINGRTRIPDKINDTAREVEEVKNVKKLDYTQQLKDMVQYAQQRGYKFVLDVRAPVLGPNGEVVTPGTVLSPTLQKMVDSGQIVLKPIDMSV